MRFRPILLVLTTLALAGCMRDATPLPTTTSGYAALIDSPIRGLTPTEIEELRTGAGMALALPAELNGYPGPKHVLELADKLLLNASQTDAVSALFASTNQAARQRGEAVLEAYQAVDQWFRAGAGNETELSRLLGVVAQREGELRQVHLAAHLECKELLTAHQLELYKELRGYGAGDHSTHH